MKKINKVLYQPGKNLYYPMIRIANNFLKEAGFQYGDKFEIRYKKNKIVIKKIIS